jgi:hypothetical protein
LKLEQLISEYSVDIFLLNVTHHESDRALRFAIYVCQWTDCPTRGAGTAIVFSIGIDNSVVPVSVLQHLKATAVHLVLVTTLVKLVAAYLSLTRPLIESDKADFSSAAIPGLMVGDLNAKHTDWNSCLTAAKGSLLRAYVNRNFSVIAGPDFPTTGPSIHNATPGVLDVVVFKYFVLPVHLIVCTALSSDHPLVVS